MPAFENGRLTFNVEANKNYFIRYSKDFSYISLDAHAIGSTTLQMSTEEYYIQKK